MSTLHDLRRAEALGRKLVAALEPACSRIEIAGSIRRRVPRVKDVEVVAMPILERNLLGEVDERGPSHLDHLVAELVEQRKLDLRKTTAGTTRNGLRFKALVAARSGIPVDLFIVRPPATWGAVFAIRTGPWEFSKALVTQLLDRNRRCVDGAVWDQTTGELLPTPEEADFFRACGVPYVEPEERRS